MWFYLNSYTYEVTGVLSKSIIIAVVILVDFCCRREQLFTICNNQKLKPKIMPGWPRGKTVSQVFGLVKLKSLKLVLAIEVHCGSIGYR